MESERTNCPKCGSNDAANILYGLPDFTDELKREIDAKRVVLGGCTVFGEDPQWHCNKCHHEWRSDM